MRRGVNWTKTTSAADEILRCRCRADESWLADCSRAVVQRLRSSDRRSIRNRKCLLAVSIFSSMKFSDGQSEFSRVFNFATWEN